MRRHSIDWQIPRGVFNHGFPSNKVSQLHFKSGWSVVCAWSSELPTFLGIYRQTATGHFVIDGNLTLLQNGKPVLKNKIVQFIESGSKSLKIKLNEAKLRSMKVSAEAPFSLKGHIDISPINEVIDRVYNASEVASDGELSKDYAKLMDTQTSGVAADVIVTCGSESISVHKTVLSARSPVFAAMFANPMSEDRDKEVVITDIDESVVVIMLRYMYTGRPFPMTVTTACDVMIAADKYQVLSLKKECCEFLKQNVYRENVLLLLDLGDAIAEDLKSYAMDFICECPEFSVIQNSEGWKSLETKKPALAMEVLSTLMKSQEKKLKLQEEKMKRSEATQGLLDICRELYGI